MTRITGDLLAGITVVPNWLDARLNHAHKQLAKARREGRGIEAARAELDRRYAQIP